MSIPQGRLTLNNAAPVMTADATAQTTLYYLPYQGANVPVSYGSTFVDYPLGSSGLSLALDSNSGHTGYQASGSLYDVFVFLNSNTLTLGTGPAWTNSTTRSAAITQIHGIWVNNASITLKYDTTSSTASVSANQATYLGTMYATANGQTGMQFKPAATTGGSNNILGLWNAYNRVWTTSQSQDSTASWSYSSPTWRPANNSTSNRISYVDGLQQSQVEATYGCFATYGSQSGSADMGVGLNTTTTPAGLTGGITGPASGGGGGSALAMDSYLAFGFNYVQALESCSNSSLGVFYSTGVAQMLKIALDM